MAQSTIWWLLAGGLVAAELLSGTFYLLMLSVGAVAAALAAMAGAEVWLQYVLAALIGGGAVVVWHLKRMRSQALQPAQANADLNLDIGEKILVNHWQPDGTTQVQYRGARWTAVLRTGALASTGTHKVVELLGNRLVVEKVET